MTTSPLELTTSIIRSAASAARRSLRNCRLIADFASAASASFAASERANERRDSTVAAMRSAAVDAATACVRSSCSFIPARFTS